MGKLSSEKPRLAILKCSAAVVVAIFLASTLQGCGKEKQQESVVEVKEAEPEAAEERIEMDGTEPGGVEKVLADAAADIQPVPQGKAKCTVGEVRRLEVGGRLKVLVEVGVGAEGEGKASVLATPIHQCQYHEESKKLTIWPDKAMERYQTLMIKVPLPLLSVDVKNSGVVYVDYVKDGANARGTIVRSAGRKIIRVSDKARVYVGETEGTDLIADSGLIEVGSASIESLEVRNKAKIRIGNLIEKPEKYSATLNASVWIFREDPGSQANKIKPEIICKEEGKIVIDGVNQCQEEPASEDSADAADDTATGSLAESSRRLVPAAHLDVLHKVSPEALPPPGRGSGRSGRSLASVSLAELVEATAAAAAASTSQNGTANGTANTTANFTAVTTEVHRPTRKVGVPMTRADRRLALADDSSCDD